MESGRNFTPALGHALLTPVYDIALRLLTREQVWRSALIAQLNPQPSDRILDVGCGTGSLAIQLRQVQGDAEIIALDPDPEVLARARRKARDAGVEIDWRLGFLDRETIADITPVSKIVSSLVFHQTPLSEKKHLLEEMHQTLRPSGSLHIADYGLQRSALMKVMFRGTVQVIDGTEDTQPNADGILPALILEAGFADVRENVIIRTPTGSVSLYSARKIA